MKKIVLVFQLVLALWCLSYVLLEAAYRNQNIKHAVQSYCFDGETTITLNGLTLSLGSEWLVGTDLSEDKLNFFHLSLSKWILQCEFWNEIAASTPNSFILEHKNEAIRLILSVEELDISQVNAVGIPGYTSVKLIDTGNTKKLLYFQDIKMLALGDQYSLSKFLRAFASDYME